MDILLYIRGGLGNQLYQYAVSRYLQETGGFDKLRILTTSYKNYKIRNLEIENFILNNHVEIVDKISICDNLVKEIYHIYQFLFRKVNKRNASQKCFRILNRQYLCGMMEYEEILLRKMDTFVYSYLVSAEICKKMKNSLMNEIVLKGTRTKQYNEYLTQIKQCPTIAVSIRCADDYVLNNWPVCSKEFYINGIKKVIEKKENCQIFVFADDLSKVKEENWFKDIDAVIVYIDRLSVCESFELMRNCNYYVCSNSSFSWWGAFLTYSEDTLIFSSNRIFGSEQKYDALTKYDEVIYLDYITGELST